MLLKRFNPVTFLIIVYGFEGIAANLAHPVTPALLKTLQMPGYMFGLAFATMQLANFLFSPFWGNLCDYIHPRVIMLVGCVGYAGGQAIFGYAQSEIMILFGRVLSGFFVSSTTITAIYTLVRITTLEQRKTSLPMLVTSFVVLGTFGQFIGGYFGEFNLYYPFIIQIVALVVCGLLFYFGLGNVEIEQKRKKGSIIKDSNPIQSFIEIKKHITPCFTIQFLTVLMISFASTSLGQTFGYYIVDVLNTGSSINGAARGVVGIISIILNSTLAIRILKSLKVERNIAIVVLLTAITMTLMVSRSNNVVFFIATGVISMSFDTVLVSVLQDRSSTYAHDDIQGIIVGAHNSMKSLGAIVGALIAGVIYDINPRYPFVLSIAVYMLCVGTLSYLSLYQSRYIND